MQKKKKTQKVIFTSSAARESFRFQLQTEIASLIRRSIELLVDKMQEQINVQLESALEQVHKLVVVELRAQAVF